MRISDWSSDVCSSDLVDDRDNTMFLRQTADCLQIDHVHSGIGGSFEEKNLCVRLDCRFPCVIVARVDTGRFDTEFGEQCIRNPAAGAEQRQNGEASVGEKGCKSVYDWGVAGDF